MSKADAQERARELGVSDEGTENEIRDRIAERERELEETGDAELGGDEQTSPGGVVASREANAALQHSTDPDGPTTRKDLTDVGVPMLQGHPDEPVGPEDALGVGEKRGDYRERILTQPHESRPIAGGGQDIKRWVDEKTGAAAEEGADGAIEVVVDRAPVSEVVPQAPRAEQIGDATALKGGVETDPDAALPAGAVRRAVEADQS